MAIDGVGVTAGAQSQLPRQAMVNQDDLLKILLTQLNYQDPLKPLDNAEFIAQLAQFTGLEQSRQTNENIEALLKMQAANQSIGMIGRTVEVATETSREVGQVTTIVFDSGSPLLTIKTADNRSLNAITLAQIQLIR